MSSASAFGSSDYPRYPHSQDGGPDIGHLAKWSVSSFKFGFGAECLRDGNQETFWHSDGPQPHSIIIEFAKKVAIQKISLCLNFTLDDSYTPSMLQIKAGTSLWDLQEVRQVALEKPDGWIDIDLANDASESADNAKALYAYVLQVVVIANHMAGKDTHVRGLRILGPPTIDTDNGDIAPFTDNRFRLYERIR